MTKTITGATTAYGIANESVVQSDVTSDAYYYRSLSSTAAASFTTNITHFDAAHLTTGAGSTILQNTGFWCRNLSGTNVWGFRGDVASGSGKWNLYMSGTANNYMAGSLGIGATSLTGYNLRVTKQITGATTSAGIFQDSTIQSDVTSHALLFWTTPSTQATAFTLTTLSHFNATQGTFGAGSVVTTQQGFVAGSNLIGATNNYGFRGLIPSGTNRWNLYMDGTAGNYLSGNLSVGTTANAERLTIGGSTPFILINNDDETSSGIRFADTQNIGERFQAVFNSGDASFRLDRVESDGTINERMRISSTGNVGIGTASPSLPLHVYNPASALAYFETTSGNGAYAIWRNSGTNFGDVGSALGISGSGSASDFMVASRAGSMILGTSSAERMRITSGGNVGIGCTPNYGKVEIQGATTDKRLYIGTNAFYSNSIDILGLSSIGGEIPLGIAGSQIQYYTGATERMRITSAGNVGIGTTSPSSKLQLSGSDLGIFSALALENLISTNPASGNGVGIDFRINNSGNPSYIAGKISLVNTFYRSNTDMTFSVANSDTLSERMRITSSGNVLIGTATDNSTTAKLQVTGGISYQNIFNTRTASYTLALTDQSKIVETNVGSANDVTIPLDSSVNFPIGTEIQVLQLGAGQTTIVATSGVTTRSKSGQLKIANVNTGVTLVKRAANDWYVIGNLTA
jgi:hypothetical protein